MHIRVIKALTNKKNREGKEKKTWLEITSSEAGLSLIVGFLTSDELRHGGGCY